jgi:hypothetical protein
MARAIWNNAVLAESDKTVIVEGRPPNRRGAGVSEVVVAQSLGSQRAARPAAFSFQYFTVISFVSQLIL